jgi:hypothetical protein
VERSRAEWVVKSSGVMDVLCRRWVAVEVVCCSRQGSRSGWRGVGAGAGGGVMSRRELVARPTGRARNEGGGRQGGRVIRIDEDEESDSSM